MDEDDTWHLIDDQPNASSRLGAVPKCKPVPTFIRNLPTSLNTELKKGGKPVPNSGRHHPYSDQPYPRRSEAAPQTERVKPFPTSSLSTPSRPSGPRTSHTVRSQSRTEFSPCRLATSMDYFHCSDWYIIVFLEGVFTLSQL